jgi:hypothetical protein
VAHTFDKAHLKTLKKLAIDLEMELESIMPLALDALAARVDSIDGLDDLSPEEVVNQLLGKSE